MKKDKIRDSVELTTLISIFLCSVFALTPNLNAYELPDTPFDFEQMNKDSLLIQEALNKRLRIIEIKNEPSAI